MKGAARLEAGELREIESFGDDALGGNDIITVGPTVQKTVWVDGGPGDDTVQFLSGNAILADKAVDVISFSHRGLGGHLVWSGHLGDHLCQYFANSGSPTKARDES